MQSVKLNEQKLKRAAQAHNRIKRGSARLQLRLLQIGREQPFPVKEPKNIFDEKF